MRASWIVAGATAALAMGIDAQAGVTIFGVMDVGAVTQTHQSAGSTTKALNSSVWNPSQWGLRGEEDLGDDLAAVFSLGSTILADVGSSSPAKHFDRNAYVGLSHRSWGSLTLGRQINTLAETLFVVDPFSTHSAATNMNIRFGYLGGPGTTISGNFGPNPGTPGANLDRVDNAIKYTFRSASNGLTGSAMVAAGEGVGGRAGGVMLGYDGAALAARVSYMEYRDVTGVPFKAYATGGTYQTGPLTFRISYADNKIDSGQDTPARPYRNMRTKIMAAGVTWVAAPLLELNLAYYQGTRTQDGQPEQRARKIYAAPEYRLSKRTSLYCIAEFETFNAAGSALDTGTPLPAGTSHSTYLGAGISHRF